MNTFISTNLQAICITLKWQKISYANLKLSCDLYCKALICLNVSGYR